MSSHLAKFLKKQIKLQKTTARGIAVRMELHESQISLVLSGKRKSIETSTLAKMVRGISPSQTVQSDLIRAALADHNITIDADFKSTAAKLPSNAQKLVKTLMAGRVSEGNLRLLIELAEKLS